MTFAEKLKLLRTSKAISQNKISNAIGITDRGYRKYESGENDPTMAVLVSIANYFNVSLDFLAGRAKYLEKGGAIMDISEIIDVFETTESKKVSEYIQLGWQLLEITKGVGSADMQMNSYFLYCLGWNKNLGEVVHPKTSPK